MAGTPSSASTFPEALEVSSGIAGGPFTQEAQSKLSSHLSGAEVRLTTSGTDALELAAITAGVEPGDVVAVPSFGFVTTALAFVRSGARIRFIDVDSRTLGMDPDDLAAKMDEDVKAVVPIHYGGIACGISEIEKVVSEYESALLIEDNAHGLFGKLGQQPLGTFGALACLSFHGTKNVSCGEGGAIVINDKSLLERAEVALEKGTNRREFLRGEVDKYTWRDLGSSFGLSDYLAALLLDQLKRVDEIQGRRSVVTARYTEVLGPLQKELGFRLPVVSAEVQPACHLFYVVMDEPSRRDAVLTQLRAKGIGASFHYPPLHLTPGGRKWSDTSESDCPVSERVAASIIRLPLDHRMNPEDAEGVALTVVESLKEESLS